MTTKLVCYRLKRLSPVCSKGGNLWLRHMFEMQVSLTGNNQFYFSFIILTVFPNISSLNVLTWNDLVKSNLQIMSEVLVSVKPTFWHTMLFSRFFPNANNTTMYSIQHNLVLSLFPFLWSIFLNDFLHIWNTFWTMVFWIFKYLVWHWPYVLSCCD